MDSYDKVFKNKNRVLFFTAHPDDAEINAGGLIARLVSDKRIVRLVVATNGINGNRQILSQDKNEFAKARLISQIRGGIRLGLRKENIKNLGYEDGYIDNGIDIIKDFVKQIRDFKPDIVITHAPVNSIIKFKPGVYWANHRDHRNVAQNVLDAVYPYSRDANFFPELIEAGYGSHVVEELLFFEQFEKDHEIYIDISNFIDKKKDSLNAHRSANVLGEKDIEVFINESQRENAYYERFGHVYINRLGTVL